MQSESSKICSQCALPKPLDEFYRHAKCADGYTGQCKDCVNARNSAYKRKNRKRINAQEAKHRRLHPEKHRERLRRYRETENGRAKFTEWVERNRDKTRAYGRKYVAAHKEQLREYGKAYKVANPDKVAIDNHRRRARKVQSEGTVSNSEWSEKLLAYGGMCHWCGDSTDAGVHMDHVMPLCLGGAHRIENVVPACSGCNLRKGSKHPDKWVKQLREERKAGM